MTQVVVIDYGMGNLHSVSKAIQAVSSSESIVISSNTDVIKAADKIVFPGVGAIKDCMEAFSVDLRETVLEEIDKKPTLAICVGMQMLLKSSEENGGVDCFDILDGKVTKINASKELKFLIWVGIELSSLKNMFCLRTYLIQVSSILCIVIVVLLLKMPLRKLLMEKASFHA